ncbi:MAG: glycosyltransferase [Verrucomicrobia bacterium]|nr:glycosyltransferase [Verrucomicrobiota bacterium]
MPSLKVLQVVASLNRDTGGPAVSVSRLAAALAARGVESHLFALDYADLGPVAAAPGCTLHTRRAGPLARRARGFSPAARRELERLAADGFDLVHNHGLWMFPNAYARHAAQRARVPLVISPRGMLETWALQRSRAKKAVAWRWFERANLAAAKMFHATAAAEIASLRAAGLRQPVALVPNGVDLPDLAATPPRKILERRFPELAGKRWLLFMSRLHAKKGVAELIAAWRAAAGKFPDWHLVIAGPDLDGYGETIRRLVAEAGLAPRLTLTGMLAGDEKACALGHAGVFVLPTHSENFGLAIAESLAAGVPVITTRGAPWEELRTHDCGWWIETGAEPLIESLNVALPLADAARREMGRRGRELVERNYSWSHVAEQLTAAYAWCCDRGEMPPCVQRA